MGSWRGVNVQLPAVVTAATLDRFFAAVAHPTRREILDRLAGTTVRVTDLAGEFPTSLNATSRHVKVLEDAGLVRRDVRGASTSSALTPSRSPRRPLGPTTTAASGTTNFDPLDAFVTGARGQGTE